MKKGRILIFWLALILIFVLGGMLSRAEFNFRNELLVNESAEITSYDIEDKVVTIVADGFAGEDSIKIVFTLDDSYNVVSYTLESEENYDSEYNGEYNGDPAPYVENLFIDTYIQNGTILETDAVAGASAKTTKAMNDALTLLDHFIDTVKGGN